MNQWMALRGFANPVGTAADDGESSRTGGIEPSAGRFGYARDAAITSYRNRFGRDPSETERKMLHRLLGLRFALDAAATDELIAAAARAVLDARSRVEQRLAIARLGAALKAHDRGGIGA